MTDWKEKVNQNRIDIAKPQNILREALENDLLNFFSEGELDNETNAERMESLYWFLDEVNQNSNKLSASILSDNDTYKSIAGYSRKQTLLDGEHPTFYAEEVKYIFDKVADWKNRSARPNELIEKLTDGEDYLKHMRRSAIKMANNELSSVLSIP